MNDLKNILLEEKFIIRENRIINLGGKCYPQKLEIDDVAIEVTSGSAWSVNGTLIVNKYIGSSEL